jgi:ParB-like chromosome segregation protein Spo0J
MQKVHPFAAAFPPLAPEAFDALCADIQANGLRNPITVDKDGQVLDGRNRLAACENVGVNPVFETYTGDDPEGFILSANVHRRHITPSQRAAVIVLQIRKGGFKAVKRKGESTRETLASMAGTSLGTVQAAQYVSDKGGRRASELLESVISGELSLQKAKREIDGAPEPKDNGLTRTAIVERLVQLEVGFATSHGATEDEETGETVDADSLYTALQELITECSPPKAAEAEAETVAA